MKKYNFFLLIFLSCFFMSCEKSERKGMNMFNYKTSVGLSIVNKKGEDLLNPATEGTLNTDKIRIWHLNKNGNFEMFYKEFLRAPYDYSISEGTDIDDNYKDYQFYLGNQVNDDFLINKMITSKIQWNETDADIVVVELKRTSNSNLVHKVWVNGDLKFDVDNHLKPVLIKLVK